MAWRRTQQGTYSLGEIETSAKRGTCVGDGG